jgi:hypothetical protein
LEVFITPECAGISLASWKTSQIISPYQNVSRETFWYDQGLKPYGGSSNLSGRAGHDKSANTYVI